MQLPSMPPHVSTRYGGTGKTVESMRDLAEGERGAKSLELRLVLENLIRNLNPRDRLSQLAAIYNWFDRHYHFVTDPLKVEQVKDPVRILEEIREYNRALGDCDDATTFLSAAGQALGSKMKIVRSGFRPRQLGAESKRFTHVFVVGYDQYGRPIVLDPVAGRRTSRMLRRVRQFASTGVHHGSR